MSTFGNYSAISIEYHRYEAYNQEHITYDDCFPLAQRSVLEDHQP